MKINTCHLVLKTNKKVKQNPSKFRGYIGREFDKYPILHNHYGNNKFLYSYPLVQYQIIDGQPSILGIEEGADILVDISSKIKALKMGDSYYRVEDHYLYYKEYDVRATRKYHQYKFLSPWLALNTKNYQSFKNIKDWKEKKSFLNNIMVGNILSMSKGLGIIVNKRLHVSSLLDDEIAEYKNVQMNAFTGEFKVNFNIPDFFGFGKGVSQGFGTVIKVTDQEED
ncbi:CRISPR-associated endonuclease Cas6 [Methanobrevibacter ruminantium]|nr:CRISPR-associated endonuclease Cas6 [Methanobrevibacter ruminantium]